MLIVLDTVRADRLPIYGYSRQTMPQLARWARGGVVALRALSSAGWTTPSHASIFSGAPVSVHGIHYSASRRLHTDARAGTQWLPQRVAEMGYSTLAVTANPQALVDDIEGFDRVFSPERKEWMYCIAM